MLQVKWGLAEIPMPFFNEYVDEAQIIEAVSSRLRLVGVANFASTYYVGPSY